MKQKPNVTALLFPEDSIHAPDMKLEYGPAFRISLNEKVEYLDEKYQVFSIMHTVDSSDYSVYTRAFLKKIEDCSC